MKATIPLVNDEGIIDLKKARHPLISKDTVVPTNIEMGTRFDTLVITGPTRAARTVSLKTIGLMCLMAMCGLMLPVSDESRVSVFDKVLSDIAMSRALNSLFPTFSAHMTNIIGIVKEADEKSLVLLEELGAGTILSKVRLWLRLCWKRCACRGCRIAATTHYAELKAYALQTPRRGKCLLRI